MYVNNLFKKVIKQIILSSIKFVIFFPLKVDAVSLLVTAMTSNF